jgi:hypothetical protein
MLVTFSTRGGGTTLTTFRKNEIPQTIQHRPQSLQRTRHRKATDNELQKSPFLKLSNGRKLSNKIEQYPRVRTQAIAFDDTEDDHSKRVPSEDHNIISTQRTVLHSVSPHSKYQLRSIHQKHQQVSKQSFSNINHASFLHQSLIRYNYAPPCQVLRDSSASCIDPRVLSKSYIPESQTYRHSGIIPPRQKTFGESGTSNSLSNKVDSSCVVFPVPQSSLQASLHQHHLLLQHLDCNSRPPFLSSKTSNPVPGQRISRDLRKGRVTCQHNKGSLQKGKVINRDNKMPSYISTEDQSLP